MKRLYIGLLVSLFCVLALGFVGCGTSGTLSQNEESIIVDYMFTANVLNAKLNHPDSVTEESLQEFRDVHNEVAMIAAKKPTALYDDEGESLTVNQLIQKYSEKYERVYQAAF